MCQRHSFIFSNLIFKFDNCCLISVSIEQDYHENIHNKTHIAIAQKTAIIKLEGEIMSEIVDSYKKIFENKKANIGIAVFALIWSISTVLFDIKFGNENSTKNNPIDFIFSLLIGVYSLQFLHNAMNNINGRILPTIKEIQPKILWGMIKLNIVWGIYAVLILIFAFTTYIFTHLLVIPIIIMVALVIISAPLYYIYLAYAENLDTKGLYNITKIFKFLKASYKPLYINICLYALISVAIMIIFAILYLLTQENYVFDIIAGFISSYLFIITWYFAFPYSLIPSYFEKIRPITNGELNG